MGSEYIYKLCEVCDGTGKVISPQVGTPDCGTCNGVGKILWGNIQDELEGEE